MIKKGDIVFCIKDFAIANQFFFKSKCYEVAEVSLANHFYIKGENYINNAQYGHWFKLETKHYNNFSDYFITLAEWREQQINLILDE